MKAIVEKMGKVLDQFSTKVKDQESIIKNLRDENRALKQKLWELQESEYSDY